MSAKPATQTQRQLQKAETRQLLLDVAQKRFIDAGIANTSITDITRAAGVAHGTFYIHFANKDDIARLLLAELNTGFATSVTRAVRRGVAGPLETAVRRVAHAFLDYWADNRGLIAALAEHLVGGLSLSDVRDGVNPPMVELLREGVAALASARGVAGADLDLLCHALLAMWMRVGLRYLFGPRISRKRAAAALVAMTTATIDAVLPPKGDLHA